MWVMKRPPLMEKTKSSGVGVPGLEAGGALKGVKGAVDLEGIEFVAGVLEFAFLGKVWG